MYSYLGSNVRKILLGKLSRIFFLFAFCITNIIADVIKLDNNALNNLNDGKKNDIKEEFKQILSNRNAVLNLIDKFFATPKDNDGQIIKHFWQMHGLCIFKYNDTENNNVYEALVSKKRNTKAEGNGVRIPQAAWNDPYRINKDNAENKELQGEFFRKSKEQGGKREYYKANLFNYSTSIHTERQVVLSCLHIIGDGTIKQEDNPKNVDIIEGRLIDKALHIAKNEQEILKYCDKCIIKQILLKSHEEAKGSTSGAMYIYTSANPCQNVSDNGGISCVGYYNELAQLFRNIQFNVYFDTDKMQLNKEFFVGNERSAVALCSFVESLVDVEGLRFGDNCIQLCRNGNWEDIAKKTDDSYNIGVEDGKNDKICILIKYINCCLRNRSFSQDKKSDLFNMVHNPNDAQGNNIPNIHYYPI